MADKSEYFYDLAGEASGDLVALEGFHALGFQRGDALAGLEVDGDDAILGAGDGGIGTEVFLQDVDLSVAALVGGLQRAVQMTFA